MTKTEYSRLWRAQHREQQRDYYKAYHAERVASDPAYAVAKREASRWTRRKAKYGLTREAYEAMATAQEGRCAICGLTPDHDLRVDHDHETGKVRALLCSGCNAGLGMFGENLTRLAAAIEYLGRHCEPRIREGQPTDDLDVRRSIRSL